MGRNLDRRVELAVPVLDPVIAETIDVANLTVLLADNVKSRELLPDGSYRRIALARATPVADQQAKLLSQAQRRHRSYSAHNRS